MVYEKLNKITAIKGKKMKRLGKTDYKYVYIVSYDGVKTYSAEIPAFRFCKCFPDIRDAAVAVDKKLMENGKDPVNIFKKKWK